MTRRAELGTPSGDIEVVPVPCFVDNYAYLIIGRGAPGLALVVDPSETAPVEAALAARGLTLSAILATHHHPDHVMGVPGLVATRPGLPVYGFASDARRIEGLTHGLHDGDVFALLGFEITTLHVPGHTLGAVAYVVRGSHGETPVVFTGDTLFIGGCGRMFEGTPEVMQRSLCAVLAALPPETEVYCGHEYSAANLRFAAAVEPGNAAVQVAAARTDTLRAEGKPTVPSTIGLERAINPFLRDGERAVRAYAKLGPDASPADVFAAIRTAKNGFG